MTRPAVAVITGAAGAMGATCVRALAPMHDALLLADRDASALERVVADLDFGGGVTTCAGDLTDAAHVRELVQAARDAGRLRSLVQVAGLSPSMAGWQQILAVDLVAVEGVLAAFDSLVEADSVAVCIASVAAHMGPFDPAMDTLLDRPLAPDFTDRFGASFPEPPDPGATYRLAKRGVVRMCERLAPSWGARGGRIVSVSPGLIDTGMGRLELENIPAKRALAELTPIQRSVDGGKPTLPGRIEDVSEAVAFLCSDAAGFLNGIDLRVDGGLVAALAHPRRDDPRTGGGS